MAKARHMHIMSGVLLISFHLCTMTLINGTLSTLKRRQAQCPCLVIRTDVDCRRKYLDSIPSCIPTNVRNFYFYGNNLMTITRRMFVNLTNVKILNLYNNRITHIEDFAFAGMHSLRNLDIGGNNLTTITRGMFVNLTNVNTLKLSNNRISHIEDFAFAGMHSLTELDLRHNVGLQIHDVICAFKHKDGFLLEQYPGKDYYELNEKCSCHYLNIQLQTMSDCTNMTLENLTSVLWNNASLCSTIDNSIMSVRCQESDVSTSSTYRDETKSLNDVNMRSTDGAQTKTSSPGDTVLDTGPIIGSVCAIVVLIAVIIVVIVIVQKRRVRRKSVTKPYESTTPPRSESEKSSSKTNSYSEAGELDPTVRIDEGADDTVTYTIPGAPGAHPRSTRSTAQRSKRGPPEAVPSEQAAREEQPEYIEIENETRHNGDDGYLVPASQYASLSPTTKSEEGHEYEKFGPKPTGSSSTAEYSGLIKSTKREKHLYDVLEKKETKQTGETGKQDPSRAAVVKKGSGKTSSSVKS